MESMLCHAMPVVCYVNETSVLRTDVLQFYENKCS